MSARKRILFSIVGLILLSSQSYANAIADRIFDQKCAAAQKACRDTRDALARCIVDRAKIETIILCSLEDLEALKDQWTDSCDLAERICGRYEP